MSDLTADGILDYTPVIEHFELSAHYIEAFDYLKASLRDKISNQATLETLATKFHQCFVETVDRCVSLSQSMPYANRSNKRNEPARVLQSTQSIVRKPRHAAPRPDSGVIIDDIYEEGVTNGCSAPSHRDSVRTVQDHSYQGNNLTSHSNAGTRPPPMSTSAMLSQRAMASVQDFHFEPSMNQASADNAPMDNAPMDHASMTYAPTDLASMSRASINHASMEHTSMTHASMNHTSMDHASIAAVQQWTDGVPLHTSDMAGLAAQWMPEALPLTTPAHIAGSMHPEYNVSLFYGNEFGTPGNYSNVPGMAGDHCS